jgi:hypothetical protein
MRVILFLVGYVVALLLIDWVQYGFDYDEEKDGTRKDRLWSMAIAIPVAIVATVWYVGCKLSGRK